MENLTTYQKRRQTLSRQNKRTMFIVSSGLEAARSHSVNHRFKPASDFYYLTGLHLADAILIVLGSECYLLQKTDHDHVWGEFTTVEEEDRKNVAGLRLENQAEFATIFQDLIAACDRIAMALGREMQVEQFVLRAISFQRRAGRSRNATLNLCDSRNLIGAVRSIKDTSEIAFLKQAAQRSSGVHRLLMQQSLIGKTERQISNWIEGQFLLQDMQWTSYETIVGAGDRSTVLHARATNRLIQKNEVVLVDAGAEVKGYCADITRALPSGNLFTSRQKEVYSAVLNAQKAAIAAARPGNTLKQIHEAAQTVLKDWLQDKTNIKNVMPHSTSHWIGLDVHDPCTYLDQNGNDVILKPGMTFTIEPGLYFNRVAGFEAYDQIGVRIEDDVVVNESGIEILTDVPKEIGEIENLRAKASDG